MLPKTKKKARIDAEQREQYDYARRRIRQKKNLLRHFIFFLAGSTLFIILNSFLHIGEDKLGKNWYIWAILIWLFFILVHLFNVFILNTFMNKEWEDKQLEKLKNKQAKRIAELQKQVETEFAPLPLDADEPIVTEDESNDLMP